MCGGVFKVNAHLLRKRSRATGSVRVCPEAGGPAAPASISNALSVGVLRVIPRGSRCLPTSAPERSRADADPR